MISEEANLCIYENDVEDMKKLIEEMENVK